jgi:hypothetical protein
MLVIPCAHVRVVSDPWTPLSFQEFGNLESTCAGGSLRLPNIPQTG